MVSNAEKVRLIFGLKLRQLRQDRGLQAYELAERAGFSPSYLNEIEKGKKYPKADKIFALARALDTDYDTLVSVKLNKRLEPIAELLNSNILQELPLDLFGIEPADLLELLSEAPSKISAFISTIIEISRNYGMNVEQFYFSALRSYQEMHDNYFPDLETAAGQFRQLQNLTDDDRLDDAWLKQYLETVAGYRIDEFSDAERPTLAGLRSVLLPDPERPTLLINRDLGPEQRALTYGREVGYQVLGIDNRPLFSSVVEAESFEQVLNNYRATYFAGAVLIPRPALIAGLSELFSRTTWNADALLALMQRFQTTPEVFMHRITHVMTSHFGIDGLFFLRFDNEMGSQFFGLTKEMHLSRLHTPHATLNEHYCRRWVSLTLLQELARQQQAGTWGGQPLCDAQISTYMDSGTTYFVVALSKPSPPKTVNSSVSLGFVVDDKLRALARFLDDPALRHRAVNETCERCGALDCLERAHAPVVWQRHRRTEALKATLADLQQQAQLIGTERT